MNCGVRNAYESDLRSNLRMLGRCNSVRKFLSKDFFIAFLTENLNFPWSSRVPKYSLREEERTNQSAKMYPKTTLPYSCKYIYIYLRKDDREYFFAYASSIGEYGMGNGNL